MSEHNRSNPNRHPNRVRKGIVMATAGPLLLAAACSNPGDKSDAPVRSTATTEVTVPEVTTTTLAEIDKNAEQAAKASVKPEAVNAAITVLDILDMPGAGTENYKGFYVGNKAAIVGADLQSGTPDDAKYSNYPESLAIFSPETGTITVRATGEHGVNTDNPSFWSVDTTFALGSNSPLLSKDSQLTTADFRHALSDGSTFELVSAKAVVGRTYDGTANDGYGAGIDFGNNGITGTLSSDVLPFDVTDRNKLSALAGGVNIALGDAAAQLRADVQQ